MTRRFLRCLVLCAAGMGCAVLLSQAQGLTPVIPPPTTSSNTSPEKITNNPVGFTPLGAAQELFRAGEFNEAIKRYNEIIKSGNDVAIAYAGLARVYLKLKKPDDAYSAAEKAVEISPSLPAAHTALGEVYFRQAKFYEAQTEFRFPIETHQEDARAYLGLSRLYDISFNFKKAKVAIDKAHALDPADPDISSAWIETRQVAERLTSMEAAAASPSNYYSRVEIARFKQRLALMKDQMEHPERTCSIANPPNSVELPLQPITRNDQPYPGVGLDVRINGLKSRLMFVGARFVVNESIAQKAKIQPIARVDIDDLGDRNPPESYVGFAPSVKIGDLEFQNCYVEVVERAAPHSFYDGLQGTIGAGAFGQYLLDIDYPDAKLKLRPLPPRPGTEDPDTATLDSGDPDAEKFHDRYVPPEMATWERAFSFAPDELFFPVRINSSPPKLFYFDLGGGTIIAPELARESTSLTSKGVSPIYGTNGIVKQTFQTGPLRLEFADFYYDMVAYSMDLTLRSEENGTEVSGLLGFDVLHNLDVKIDYRDGLIHFVNGREPH